MLKNLRERCSEEVQFSSLSLVSDMINEFGDSEIYSDQGRGGMGGGGSRSMLCPGGGGGFFNCSL